MTSPAPVPGAKKPTLSVLLAAPRGFCAGVERAVEVVEQALSRYGAPVYVRHEIVHNAHVVARLRRLGAVFVDDLADAPADRPVIFSAHGVPKSVPLEAERRAMTYIDATCPLVSKVHLEVMRRHREGFQILLIGHDGHPEVLGTLGQLSDGAVALIESVADAEAFEPRNRAKLAYVTQTTLSVDDTAAVIAILKRRFPRIRAPFKEDICYATTNRQAAIKEIASKVDAVLVIGSPNSSNSARLVETARKAGCKRAMLIDRVERLAFSALDGVRSLGVTAGASAPEELVEAMLAQLRKWFDLDVQEVSVAREDVSFKLPKAVSAAHG